MKNKHAWIGIFFFLALSLAILRPTESAQAWTIVEPGHSHDDNEETEHAADGHDAADHASPTTIPNQPVTKRGYVPPPAPAYLRTTPTRLYAPLRSWQTRNYPTYHSYRPTPVVYYGRYSSY